MTTSDKSRHETLKRIIKSIQPGADLSQTKEDLKQLVQQTEPGEITRIEQELIDEGMPVEEVKSMCDLHSQVVSEILSQSRDFGLPSGHPIDTFHRENEAIANVICRMREAAEEIQFLPDNSDPGAFVFKLWAIFNELMDINKHYQRKEYLLFPKLEKYGVSGPSQVMWAKDDEAREKLKAVAEAINAPDMTIFRLRHISDEVIEPALEAINEMIHKEEKILFPMSLEKLNPGDWAEIWKLSPEYGYALVDPGDAYVPSEADAQVQVAKEGEENLIVFPTGALTTDQLRAILTKIPFELTFVDHDDTVRFYSEASDPIFKRGKAVLGRKVQNCHPPKSLKLVNKILDDFRNGHESVAEFWIHMDGKFIHIRYFAVRDPESNYMGTLEVAQEIGRIQALKGERRL